MDENARLFYLAIAYLLVDWLYLDLCKWCMDRKQLSGSTFDRLPLRNTCATLARTHRSSELHRLGF